MAEKNRNHDRTKSADESDSLFGGGEQLQQGNNDRNRSNNSHMHSVNVNTLGIAGPIYASK